MKEMIETYKQQIPEEEFVEFEAIERGESKFVVSSIVNITLKYKS